MCGCCANSSERRNKNAEGVEKAVEAGTGGIKSILVLAFGGLIAFELIKNRK